MRRPWPPSSRCAAAVAAAIAVASVSVLGGGAAAEPVPIGRFAELASGDSQRGGYPEPAGGPARQGRIQHPAPAARMRPQWTLQLQMRSLTPPVQAADGTLYVGGDRGVAAVTPAGALRWLAAVGGVAQSPTLLPDGGLLVVAGGRLLRIDAQGEAGELSVGLRVAGELLRLPSGAIILGTPGGQVQALDPTGVRLLGVPVPPSRSYALALLGDEVAVVGPPDLLSIVSLVSGLRRQLPLPHVAAAGPVVGARGTVWTVGEDGSLLGQGPTGRLRARVALGTGRPRLPPAVGRDGLLRIGAHPDLLLGLDAGGGQRFALQLDAAPGPVSLAAGDVALVVTSAGTLFVVEADGRMRFRQAVQARGVIRAVPGPDGQVFIADPVGRLTAWR